MKTLNRYRILYAENNKDGQGLVTFLCELSGIKVVTAETAGETWQLAQSKRFDLYLLESRFPDGDGFELCRRLKTYAPHTPVLFYSGDAYEADRKKGLAAGACDYLTKPYTGELAETVRQNIERTANLSKRYRLPAAGIGSWAV